MFDNRKIYKGPYADSGPDLISGYNIGYRISWNGATGVVNDEVFEDNTKAWSGDHCIDPRLVPGVVFCNQKVKASQPALMDLAPTVLGLFGVPTPTYMEGKSIFEPDTQAKQPEMASKTIDKKTEEAVVLDEQV